MAGDGRAPRGTLMQRMKPLLAMGGLLLFGGVTTIATNDAFTTTTLNMPGHEGTPFEFNWPFFVNLWMFAGMSLSSFYWIYELQRDKRKRAAESLASKAEAETDEVREAPARAAGARRAGCCRRCLSNAWGVLVFSSIFDLIASNMGSIGLSPTCNVPASVYQMLMGSIMIFTPILAFFFLKQIPSKKQLLAIFLCIIGVCAVGLSSWLATVLYPETEALTVLLPSADGASVAMSVPVDVAAAPLWQRLLFKPNHIARLAGSRLVDLSLIPGGPDAAVPQVGTASTGMLILGLFLIILAQVIYAGQFVVEEFTMKKINSYPTQVVGIEGIYGLLITVAIVFPFTYVTGIENDYEAFIFIAVEPKILVPLFIFFVAVTLYNMFGQTITRMISASHRTIIEALRGLVVWVFALIEGAIFGAPWGERLYGWASALEAVGFVITFLGALLYYDVIKSKAKCLEGPMPCCCKPLKERSGYVPAATEAGIDISEEDKAELLGDGDED